MAGVAGIKETKELLVGLNEVALCLISLLKDGIQMADLGAVFDKMQTDLEFKAKVEAAYKGLSAVGTEVGDLQVSEILELAKAQIDYLDDYMDALKKPVPVPAP